MLQDIKNFLQLTDTLGTSGQPSEAQLADIASAGYEMVINLALPNADYSLPDERASVEKLGMTYLHIPVIWQDPRPENLKAFCAAMQANQAKKLFVHCAANMRVSAFMALYRIIYHGWPQEQAFREMHRIWTPDGVWKNFIDQVLANPDLARQV